MRTPGDRADRIASDRQRRVVDNMQRAQALGAEVVTLEGADVAQALLDFAQSRGCSMIIIGPTRHGWWGRVLRPSIAAALLAAKRDVDVLVVRTSAEGAQ